MPELIILHILILKHFSSKQGYGDKIKVIVRQWIKKFNFFFFARNFYFDESIVLIV